MKMVQISRTNTFGARTSEGDTKRETLLLKEKGRNTNLLLRVDQIQELELTALEAQGAAHQPPLRLQLHGN